MEIADTVAIILPDSVQCRRQQLGISVKYSKKKLYFNIIYPQPFRYILYTTQIYMPRRQFLSAWFICNSISFKDSFKIIKYLNNQVYKEATIDKFSSMFYSTVPVNSPGKSEREVLLPGNILDNAEGKKRDRKPVITFVTGNKKKYNH